MSHGICPNCNNKVFIDMEPEIGFSLVCETCQTPIVIVWLNPIEISLIDYDDYEIIDEGSNTNKFKKSIKKGEYDGPRKNKTRKKTSD